MAWRTHNYSVSNLMAVIYEVKTQTRTSYTRGDKLTAFSQSSCSLVVAVPWMVTDARTMIK